ncbi:helix-turn-helix domain-containing protein [Kibdelosporangium lantanae]|uniref:Helix-turn-helix domain-containing protein n=1 Tax=Kibdelosporangium lantanae TaxID=1497396 RepID=A0ABW3M8R6_9PSEU
MVNTPISLLFSGRRLREWRERAGLTQRELAEKCCLSRYQISRWEVGTAKPRPGALKLLTLGLGEALGRPAHRMNAFTVDDLLEAGRRPL